MTSQQQQYQQLLRQQQQHQAQNKLPPQISHPQLPPHTQPQQLPQQPQPSQSHHSPSFPQQYQSPSQGGGPYHSPSPSNARMVNNGPQTLPQGSAGGGQGLLGSQSASTSAAPASASGGTQATTSSVVPALSTIAYQHGMSFRTAFDQFFHGMDGFLTASEANPPLPSAQADEAVNKLYQKYMQLELEADNLMLYLQQTERKLRAELDEPSVTVDQMNQQQARYQQQMQLQYPSQKSFPPLPPSMALFRAQYDQLKRATVGPADLSLTSPQQQQPHSNDLKSPTRPTPNSQSSSNNQEGQLHPTAHTPRTPATLLTPTNQTGSQLTPNPLPPSPAQPTVTDPTSNAMEL